MSRLLVFCALVLMLTSCASSSGPVRQRSEFEDVPVPAGITMPVVTAIFHSNSPRPSKLATGP